MRGERRSVVIKGRLKRPERKLNQVPVSAEPERHGSIKRRDLRATDEGQELTRPLILFLHILIFWRRYFALVFLVRLHQTRVVELIKYRRQKTTSAVETRELPAARRCLMLSLFVDSKVRNTVVLSTLVRVLYKTKNGPLNIHQTSSLKRTVV